MLGGLSATSRLYEQSAGIYDTGDPNNLYAYDGFGPIGLGGSATSPPGNVQNYSGSCTPGVSWYGQIDLIGGSMRLPDEIFQSGFE